MIIGDKEDFAVEYTYAHNHPSDMGYGKIWIKNKFIGSSQDLIFLPGYLLGTLNELRTAKELKHDWRNSTKEQLLNLLSVATHKDSYQVRGATFTDDFSIWTYRLKDRTYFLWQIIQTDSFDDLKDYQRDVFLESVKTDTLKSVTHQLETQFKDKGILKGS